MDFLDPKKERRNRLALIIGYGLVGTAIAISSIVLMYQTDGYCVDRKGAVDRCGLVFVASQPTASSVMINGKIQDAQTNTKFNLQSGSYEFRVFQEGYQDWRRNIAVQGGDVQRFDYPLLIPRELKTTDITTFAGGLQLVTQSPDRRWVIAVESSGPSTIFHRYDIRQTPKPGSGTLSIPATILTVAAANSQQEWKLTEWSTDNRHVLLERIFQLPVTGDSAQISQPSKEYILLDRDSPAQSRNLTRDLGLAAQESLSLFDKKPTQFFGYNSETKVLRTLALNGSPSPDTQLARVQAYKTDGDDTILYVTDTPPSGIVTPGKVSVVMQRGEQVRVIRQLSADSAEYLLDVARYDGDWYVVVGESGNKGVFVYRNPINQSLEGRSSFPAPIRFLRLAEADRARFSATAQFIAVQHGQQVLIYDIKDDDVYRYNLAVTLDAPQKYLEWVDGHRLAGVSEGKGYIVDYDNINARVLAPADGASGLFFTPNFRGLVSVQQSTPGAKLLLTSLIAP